MTRPHAVDRLGRGRDALELLTLKILILKFSFRLRYGQPKNNAAHVGRNRTPAARWSKQAVTEARRIASASVATRRRKI
jgi:hypothetical protein